MIPNEHDEPATAREPDQRADGELEQRVNGELERHADGELEQRANGAAEDAGLPAVPRIVPDAADRPADELDEAPYDDYVTSGANPFSSVHPQGPGIFPRLFPREFPQDDAPPDVPAMEPLPDPNTLPGYPGGDGYAFPPVASAFPVAPESADHVPEPAPAFPASSYQHHVDPYQTDPYRPDPYQADPYQAPRSPDAAPPLPGTPGHWPDVRAATRPQEAPPLAPTPPAPTPLAPPSLASPPSVPPSAPPSAFQPRSPQSSPPASPPAGSPGMPGAPAGGPGPAEPGSWEPLVRETADSLTADVLLHGRRSAPGPGWRRTVYRASGGLIRVPESAAVLRQRDLMTRVRTPVAGGHHRVAVMSLKGGVGKTTTAVGLGATLASLRGDRVIAVDANPDRGTLSDKVRLETSATIRDLLNERAQVTRYADVRAYTSQASSRLEILASDRDPGVSTAFSADDYRAVARVLEHYYSLCITDCGTGLLHSAMSGILELADHIVLVSSPSVDGARSASATLDWLEAHDYADLVRDCVVVLSTIRPKSKSTVDLDRLEQHFASRSRAVVRIPYDAHLEEGAEVELELLSAETADAYLTLAALVGDGFTVPRRPVSRITRTGRFA